MIIVILMVVTSLLFGGAVYVSNDLIPLVVFSLPLSMLINDKIEKYLDNN